MPPSDSESCASRKDAGEEATVSDSDDDIIIMEAVSDAATGGAGPKLIKNEVVPDEYREIEIASGFCKSSGVSGDTATPGSTPQDVAAAASTSESAAAATQLACTPSAAIIPAFSSAAAAALTTICPFATAAAATASPASPITVAAAAALATRLFNGADQKNSSKLIYPKVEVKDEVADDTETVTSSLPSIEPDRAAASAAESKAAAAAVAATEAATAVAETLDVARSKKRRGLAIRSREPGQKGKLSKGQAVHSKRQTARREEVARAAAAAGSDSERAAESDAAMDQSNNSQTEPMVIEESEDSVQQLQPAATERRLPPIPPRFPPKRVIEEEVEEDEVVTYSCESQEEDNESKRTVYLRNLDKIAHDVVTLEEYFTSRLSSCVSIHIDSVIDCEFATGRVKFETPLDKIDCLKTGGGARVVNGLTIHIMGKERKDTRTRSVSERRRREEREEEVERGRGRETRRERKSRQMDERDDSRSRSREGGRRKRGEQFGSYNRETREWARYSQHCGREGWEERSRSPIARHGRQPSVLPDVIDITSDDEEVLVVPPLLQPQQLQCTIVQQAGQKVQQNALQRVRDRRETDDTQQRTSRPLNVMGREECNYFRRQLGSALRSNVSEFSRR